MVLNWSGHHGCSWYFLSGLLHPSVMQVSMIDASHRSFSSNLHLDAKHTGWYVLRMTINHLRKKQPAVVKASLMECARTLAARNGLSTTSVQAICDMAGVTKGAFFHHFPDKDALLTSVFEQMVVDFSAEIKLRMTMDPSEVGAFTRAYLEMGALTIDNPDMVTLWKSAMADERICEIWREWYLNALSERGDLESSPELAMVRLAADGLCLGVSMKIIPGDLDAVLSVLRCISSASLTK